MHRLLIVDDHVLFRDGIASLFTRQSEFCVVGEAGSVSEAIEKAHQLRPEIILMDFSLPDGTGLDATRAVLAELPLTKIVFLTMDGEDERLFAALRSGAKGFLLKDLSVDELFTSLRGLVNGEPALSRQMISRVLDEFARSEPAAGVESNLRLSQLTSREIEILRELAGGASNQEIAERLFISTNTVKNHVHNVLEKLGLKNRRELAAFAARHSLSPISH